MAHNLLREWASLSEDELDLYDLEDVAARVRALLAEFDELQAIIQLIDARAPRADATCVDPGITLSEAARRTLRDLQRLEKPTTTAPPTDA